MLCLVEGRCFTVSLWGLIADLTLFISALFRLILIGCGHNFILWIRKPFFSVSCFYLLF